MPVYNEQESITQVVKEWLPVFDQYANGFTWCILNDGSKDQTAEILQGLANTHPQLKIINKPNSGHGQTCVLGYKTAIENGAEWVFQIDSDGQCDPQYFGAMAQNAQQYPLQYGFRRTREDGFKRWLVSRVVTWFVWIATKQWVRDANVPYRLMHRSTLTNVAYAIPSTFYLANILVAVLQRKAMPIHWVDIHFRERAGGEPSVKTFTFAKHGIKLYRQLRQAIK